MTNQQARQALDQSHRVAGGQGEDRDYGRIHRIDGDMAVVGWESGVNTSCPIADLEIA